MSVKIVTVSLSHVMNLYLSRWKKATHRSIEHLLLCMFQRWRWINLHWAYGYATYGDVLIISLFLPIKPWHHWNSFLYWLDCGWPQLLFCQWETLLQPPSKPTADMYFNTLRDLQIWGGVSFNGLGLEKYFYLYSQNLSENQGIGSLCLLLSFSWMLCETAGYNYLVS